MAGRKAPPCRIAVHCQGKFRTHLAISRLRADLSSLERSHTHSNVSMDTVRFHVFIDHARGNFAIHRSADETYALRQAHDEIHA